MQGIFDAFFEFGIGIGGHVPRSPSVIAWRRCQLPQEGAFGRPYGVAAVNHAARAMRARRADANTAVLSHAHSPKGAAHPDRETGQGMKSLARVQGRR